MCTIKNYLDALDKEIQLRLNGYQTTLLEAKFEETDNAGYVYSLYESKRTRSKFEDVLNAFKQSFDKGFGCYQVPERTVPKAKLQPENLCTIIGFKKNKDGSPAMIRLKEKIKDGHLLCISPSITPIIAEISALEYICKFQASLSPITRNNVEKFNAQYSSAKEIPTVLSKLFLKECLTLPSFQVKEIPENEYVILKDNNRPGNSEQRKFVCNALSTPDFTIKIGPPGSGKTTSIVELIIQLIKRRKRILLVASTNVAVDNIIERLANHLDLACIKRYGNGENDRISPIAKRFLAGSEFKKQEAKALKTRLSEIPEEERSDEQKEMIKCSDVKNNDLLYEILQENAPIVAGTTFGASLAEMKKLHNREMDEAPFDYMILDEASKTTIQEFLVPAVLCKHWIIVGDTKQLSPYVSDEDLAENAKICYSDDPEKNLEYRIASDTLLAKKGNKSRQTVILVEKESEYDAYLYRKYAKKNNVLFADADKEEDEELLPYATIIIGSIPSFKRNREKISPRITTVRMACDKMSGRFLHEEEMQPWLSIARYNRENIFKRFDENLPREWSDEISWRLIRMFEQRNNIVNTDKSPLERLKQEVAELIPESDAEECKKNLQIFEQIYLPSCMELFLNGFWAYKDLAIFRGFPKNILNERCIKLSYQHRSHPDIAEFASKEFYSGAAMLSEHMKDKREWAYTRFKDYVHWEHIKGKCDTKNRNKEEQKWIERELKNFCRFATAPKTRPKEGKEKFSVAVLSFYKEQAEELKKICNRVFKDAKKFVEYSAGSVDSFQGHEADIVFLSYSNQVPTCFIEAPNRLNVAITRARYMMVHVGNWNAMSKSKGALGRIVQKMKSFTHNLKQ